MSLSIEIHRKLNVLGLSPGATETEIRSAFRRLARTCHPDIIGGRGNYHFQQITSAYSFLKGLKQEELMSQTQAKTKSKQAAKKSRGWSNPFAWRREKQNSEKTKTDTADRSRQHSEQMEKERRAAVQRDRVDFILKRSERALIVLKARIEKEEHQGRIDELLMRLQSSVPGVRHLALSETGFLTNSILIIDAFIMLLLRWDVDEKTARLISIMPFTPTSRLYMAKALVERASSLPDSLIFTFLDLRGKSISDIKLFESYLCYASESGICHILRHWPDGTKISDSVLRHLLNSESERVLLATLSIIKQRFPQSAQRHGDRIAALAEHPSAAVRVWSLSLLRK